ncbi:MAG: TonB-dependent receptor [Flavisolibacter sp.]
MFRMVFFVFINYAFVLNLQAQVISGKITDKYARPLNFATVHLLNSNLATTSNHEGQFNIYNVIPGNYVIEVSAIGYATIAKEIVINDYNNPTFDFSLENSLVQLDAVTVTAEKREDLVQNIPVSITVLNSKQVQDFRMWDIKQLSAIVPNLYSGNPGDQRNVTSIRGIITTSYDPSVVTYIDGVNQFNLNTYISSLLDIERIEVLRGPQGTLYGRNAMGGVINIITKQPSNRMEGFVELNVGNYGQQRYVSGIRIPLVKNKLFLGASGAFNKINGYYTNLYNNSFFDRQEGFNGNYFLKFIPNVKWSILLNAKHQNNSNYGAFPLVIGQDKALKKPFQVNQNAVSKMNDKSYDASLSINHIGSKVNFSSQFAWQSNYRYYTDPIDADFSPRDGVTIMNNYGTPWNIVKVLTHELRFNSAAKKSLVWNWTAGSYFFHLYHPRKQATHFGKDGRLFGAPDINFSTISTTYTRNTGLALYGQVNYSLSKKFEIVGGLRYDYERKNLNVKGELQKDGKDAMVTRSDTAGSVNFSTASPKLALKYQVSDYSNLHVSYARGYRTGGLSPLSSDPSQPPLYPYKPENSSNIELGIKNNFLKERFVLNITGFLTYVNNAQVPTLLLPEAITVTKNTGSITSRGVEMELSVKPVKGFQFDYNLGYTRAQYNSLKVATNGQTVNLDGKKQIFTPDITSMLAVQYSYILFPKQQIKAVARGEWHYLGTQYFDQANKIRQSPYNLLNTRVGISSKHIELFFWSRNITNTKFIEYAYDFGAVHLGNPEIYGITLGGSL